MLGLLCATTLLQSCEILTTEITATGPRMVPCEVVPVITFSAKSDSEETVKQIRRNNAAWRAVCQ